MNHRRRRYDHVCLVHEIFYFDEAEKQARCTDSRSSLCKFKESAQKYYIAPAATAHAHDPAAARRHTYHNHLPDRATDRGRRSPYYVRTVRPLRTRRQLWSTVSETHTG
jgi:hypothetical protein